MTSAAISHLDITKNGPVNWSYWYFVETLLPFKTATFIAFTKPFEKIWVCLSKNWVSMGKINYTVYGSFKTVFVTCVITLRSLALFEGQVLTILTVF